MERLFEDMKYSEKILNISIYHCVSLENISFQMHQTVYFLGSTKKKKNIYNLFLLLFSLYSLGANSRSLVTTWCLNILTWWLIFGIKSPSLGEFFVFRLIIWQKLHSTAMLRQKSRVILAIIKPKSRFLLDHLTKITFFSDFLLKVAAYFEMFDIIFFAIF